MYAALESDAPLIVYIDVKSPYAYIALEPTLALEAELGLVFDWRPLTLDIPSYLGSAKKSSTGKLVENKRSPQQWSAVKYAYRDARRYAKRQGRLLLGTQKIWDSSIANIGILWTTDNARERLPTYLDNVYTPFWKRELDIEDPNVVARVLDASGVDADGFIEFAAGAGRARHDQLQSTLHPAGIFGVPTYVIDGEFYFGREHLPLVRWRLEGSHRPAPDVAYTL
jgi:2-hydroxychromene-2-carboxylate isomerase